MMDMNLNLDVTMESVGHIAVHHGPGKSGQANLSIDFDSVQEVLTDILVANGARPACMATMVKQVDANPTAIASIKSITVLDHAPFLIEIECNATP